MDLKEENLVTRGGLIVVVDDVKEDKLFQEVELEGFLLLIQLGGLEED